MLATLQRIVPFFGQKQKDTPQQTQKQLPPKPSAIPRSSSQLVVVDDDNIEFDEIKRNTKNDDYDDQWQTISRNDLDLQNNNYNIVDLNNNIKSEANKDEIKSESQPKKNDSSFKRIWRFPFKNSNEYIVNDDISNGNEKFKIPAISYKKNDKAPDDYHYISDYVESRPLFINRSLMLLSNCQCLNDEICNNGYCNCSSNYKSGRYYNSNGCLTSDYDFNSPQVIYECNLSCKCNKSYCKNMVIQNGCQQKLILFKTKSRGWGIKTIDNLNKGTFIGIYSGELITGSDSLTRKDDTYLFNLSTSDILINNNNNKDEIINDENNNNNNNNNDSEKDSRQFVCDAKKFGNFTRFINHSCEPNVIGIRSFTQHHDQRFPYIAFFTNQDIKANSELTLNYGDNYWLIKCRRDKIFCLCKRSSCRFSKKTFQQTMKLYNERTQSKV